MPTFFNRNELPPEQQARWDWAVAEYDRIQDENLDRAIAKMSPDERRQIMASLRDEGEDDTHRLREHLKAFRDLMGGGAGNGKSALFARLLQGKPALPFPPPTSLSYPWYAVVEEDGPFNVMVDGLTFGEPELDARIKKGAVITINQCLWTVVSRNAAAERLSALQAELSATARPEKEGAIHCSHTWSVRLLESVLGAYGGGPEFIVRYGEWGNYRLALGRKPSTCQRGYAMDAIVETITRQVDRLSVCGSVFDVGRFFLNAEFGEVVSPGVHPRDRLAQSRAKAEENGLYAGLFDRLFEQQEDSLDEDVAEFEVAPERADFIALTYDDWMLAKVPA